jgi:tol-pal system protein YbgF
MKRNTLTTALAVLTIGVFNALSAQGFRLNQPDEVGGSFTAMHQDALKSSSSAGPGLEVFIRYRVSPNFMLSAGTGFYTAMDKTFSWDVYKTTMFPSLEIKGIIMPQGNRKVIPMGFAGLNMFGWKWTSKYLGKTYSSDKTYYDASILLGGGLQFIANEKVSYHVTADYRYVFSMSSDPKLKFWTAKVGLSYALTQSRRSTYQKKEEIEYPMGEQELATLDDLFKENTGKGGSDEDALSLLFQPEQGEAAKIGGESETKTGDEEQDLSSLFGTEESASETTSSNYPDTEIGKLMARVDELKSEMDLKSQQVEKLQTKVEANEKTLAELSGEEPGISREPLPDSEFKVKYASALDKFHMRQYRAAISDFQSLAASNPKNMLASNCHYWMGECYNAMGDYRKAIAQFQNVLNYRNSYKLAPALIMSGLCYLKMGDNNTARVQFQELVDRYPESEYAPKAMRYLGSL